MQLRCGVLCGVSSAPPVETSGSPCSALLVTQLEGERLRVYVPQEWGCGHVDHVGTDVVTLSKLGRGRSIAARPISVATLSSFLRRIVNHGTDLARLCKQYIVSC